MAFNRDKALAAAAKFAAKGQHDRAAKEYAAVVEADPSDIRSWLLLADALKLMGDTAGAIERFLHVGKHYTEAGEHQKALAVYRQVLQIDAGRLDVQGKVAGLYKELGRTQDAIAAYEFVAQAHFQAGQIAEGLEGFRMVAELDPGAVGKRLRLAELYSREGMVPQAVEHFRLAADKLFNDRRLDDYIRVAERLIYHKEDDLPVLRSLARIYLSQNENRRALVKLNALLRSAPADPEGLELLADTFVALGKQDKAVSVLQELAREQRKGGRKAKVLAARVLKKAIALGPENAEDLKKIAADIDAEIAALPADPKEQTEDVDLDVDVVEEEAPSGGGDLDLDVEVEDVPSRPFAGVGANLAPSAAEQPEDNVGDTDKLLLEVRVYVKYKMHEHALGHLDSIFVRDPNNVAALELQASILETLDRAAEAADTYVRLAQLTAARDAKLAREQIERALKLAPNHTKAEMVLAALDSGSGVASDQVAPLVRGLKDRFDGGADTSGTRPLSEAANDVAPKTGPNEQVTAAEASAAKAAPTETSAAKAVEPAAAETSAAKAVEPVTTETSAAKPIETVTETATSAAEPVEPAVAETSAAKAAPTETSAAKAAPTETSAAKAAPTETSAAKAAPTETSAAKAAPTETSAAKPVESSVTETSAAKAAPTETSAAKPVESSVTETSAAKKVEATETSAAKAAPTETSVAKKVEATETRVASNLDTPTETSVAKAVREDSGLKNLSPRGDDGERIESAAGKTPLPGPLPTRVTEKTPLPRLSSEKTPLPVFKPPSGIKPAGAEDKPAEAKAPRKAPAFRPPTPSREPQEEVVEELDDVEELEAVEVEAEPEPVRPAPPKKTPPKPAAAPPQRPGKPPPPKSAPPPKQPAAKSAPVSEDSTAKAAPSEVSEAKPVREDSVAKAAPQPVREDSVAKAAPSEVSEAEAVSEDSTAKTAPTPEVSEAKTGPAAVSKDSEPEAAEAPAAKAEPGAVSKDSEPASAEAPAAKAEPVSQAAEAPGAVSEGRKPEGEPEAVSEGSKPASAEAPAAKAEPEAVSEDSKPEAVSASAEAPAAKAEPEAVSEDSKPASAEAAAKAELEAVSEDSKPEAVSASAEAPAAKAEPGAVSEDSKPASAELEAPAATQSPEPAAKPDAAPEAVLEDSAAKPAADASAQTEAAVGSTPAARPDSAPSDSPTAPAAAGEPASAPQTEWPSIDDEVEELRFFIASRFEDDAQFTYLELQRRFPGHPALAEFADRFSTGAKLESAAAPVVVVDAPAAPAVPATAPGKAAPAAPQFEDEDDDFLSSIFDEPVAAPAPSRKTGPQRAVATLDEQADAQTLFDLGMAYHEMGLIDDALTQFGLAAGDRRWTSRANVMIADLRILRGEPDAAIGALEEAIAAAGDDDERDAARYRLAEIFATVGNLAAAASTLRLITPGYRERDALLAQYEST